MRRRLTSPLHPLHLRQGKALARIELQCLVLVERSYKNKLGRTERCLLPSALAAVAGMCPPSPPSAKPSSRSQPSHCVTVITMQGPVLLLTRGTAIED